MQRLRVSLVQVRGEGRDGYILGVPLIWPISINILKQYSLLSLVNTHISSFKYQKMKMGSSRRNLKQNLEKPLSMLRDFPLWHI